MFSWHYSLWSRTYRLGILNTMCLSDSSWIIIQFWCTRQYKYRTQCIGHRVQYHTRELLLNKLLKKIYPEMFKYTFHYITKYTYKLNRTLKLSLKFFKISKNMYKKILKRKVLVVPLDISFTNSFHRTWYLRCKESIVYCLFKTSLQEKRTDSKLSVRS